MGEEKEKQGVSPCKPEMSLIMQTYLPIILVGLCAARYANTA
jgi:hypothetical protein